LIDKKQIFQDEEKAVLIGVIHKGQPDRLVTEYMDELAFLAETAGAVPVKRFTQKLGHPDSKTYIGKGKVDEIRQYIQGKDIKVAIFDDELTGAQISNLEKVLDIKTIDRSDLILDIFARRAKTAQARAQVELAQYQYILPRLRGMWKHLERLGGGIGTRGPGESEIETDRRIVREKISLLRRRLKEIDRQAFTQRKERGEFIRIALVGYTNVGKSTLMNLITKSDVLAENKLFATLDTTTRKVVYENTPFLISDTVGFIRKLPHHLVESFKSTLDEVKESDVLLHVIDISHPQYEEQMHVVQETLASMQCHEKPVICIFNKMDMYERNTFDEWLDPEVKEQMLKDLHARWENETNGNCVFISATERKNIDILRQTILEKVREMYKIRYPYKMEFH
jgi:GTP-binding protein HflX